jgi:hypothetical protein
MVEHGEDVTPAEIGRQLTDLKTAMRDGFQSINGRLDRYVLAEVHALSTSILSERMSKLEAQIASERAERATGGRWTVSTVVSALAVLSALVLGVIGLLSGN